jgi:hypothetical protein
MRFKSRGDRTTPRQVEFALPIFDAGDVKVGLIIIVMMIID